MASLEAKRKKEDKKDKKREERLKQMTKDRIARFAKEKDKRQQNKIRLQTEQKYFETEQREKAREFEAEDLRWKERMEKREKDLVEKIQIND